MLFIGVDYASGESRTVIDWKCQQCGQPATSVGIVVKQIEVKTKSSFYVNEVFIKGWHSIEGNCEFIPTCGEHDMGTSAYVLKCNLTDRVKQEFDQKLNLENSRDIQL